MSHWRRSQRLEMPHNFHSLFSKTRCLWSLICGSCCHNQADCSLIERSAWLRLLRFLGTEGLNPMAMLLFTAETGRLGWKNFPARYVREVKITRSMAAWKYKIVWYMERKPAYCAENQPFYFIEKSDFYISIYFVVIRAKYRINSQCKNPCK